MRRNTLNKLLIVCICCSLAAFGCKAKKQTVAGPKPVTATPDKSLNKLDAIRSSQSSYNTFSGKAKTKLDINGSSNDVTLNIRIQNGKKIWVSITAIAGIEVARALITPDSLLVINKLQGLYLQKPFAYIYAYTSQQINFDSLEALLVGNAIPQLINNNAQLEADSGRTVMSGNLQELAYKLVLGADLKANHTELANQDAGQSLTVDNSVFIPATNRVLPSQIDMSSVMPKKKIKMNLHYIKADFDQPLEYPFSIPSGYSPAK
ncbi:MAG: DUF4292 domain-containing protein [Mucilaginibacter sp.]|nr:DUF4292 domain-containing protein [Mucilaginibacter sp.]